MADSKNWKKIKISGRVMVSDFQRIHCTDFKSAEITPEELGEPGQVLARLDGDYYPVYLDHYEGEDVFIKIDGKVYKVEPRLEISLKVPLSYAWAETNVFVEPAERSRKEILDDSKSTQEQKREVIDWCLEHLSEAEGNLLKQVADMLYFPEYRILDHEGAKRCYLELAQRPGCPPGEIWRFYGRVARISYLALNPEEGDLYAEKAMGPQVYGGDIQPLIYKADYEWYKAGHENYSSLYRYGKLPVIKSLVELRRPEAMAYLLDRIVPLEDEGMRCYAELCETCLMETYRKSREEDFNAIAPVAFYKFSDCQTIDDFERFKDSWPYQQLKRGRDRGWSSPMYYYALIEEILGLTFKEDDLEEARRHFKTAMEYYRRCAEGCHRQAMVGLVSLITDHDPDNPDLPFYVKCLRAFSYRDQKYKFLGDEDPDEPLYSPIDDFGEDDLPDDDGRFDAWA